MVMQVSAVGNWCTNLPAGFILARPRLNACLPQADWHRASQTLPIWWWEYIRQHQVWVIIQTH